MTMLKLNLFDGDTDKTFIDNDVSQDQEGKWFQTVKPSLQLQSSKVGIDVQ